jgi:multiple sugar transport system permease protein
MPSTADESRGNVVVRFFAHLREKAVRHGFVLVVLTPAVLWILAFRYLPIAKLGDLSLQTGAAGRSDYVGGANYKEALSDSIFHTALIHTVEYTVLFLVVQLPLALLIAAGIDALRRESARRTVLTLYFLPLVTSTVATAVVFVYLYHPVYGLLNLGLKSMGLPALSYLNDPTQALPAVTAMAVWKSLGFPVIIFLAGLQSIPRELYDAAAVDGAGVWSRFRRITLPLLRPTTTLLLVIQGVESLRVFTPVYVMTGTSSSPPGGPANSTIVWSLDIFQQAFQFNRLGYASALAMLMFIVVAIFMVIQVKVSRVGTEY